MKLTMILMTAAFIHVQAAGFSQKITFTGRNIPVEEIFGIINQQTGYTVFANKGLLKQTSLITIEAYNMPLQQFLAAALKNQPLQFTIAANTVVLSRKPVTSAPETAEELSVPLPITGIVLDAEGKPIVGASITIKKSAIGTVTDAGGRFSLNANPGDILVISFVGYDRHEIKVEKDQVYSIKLKLSNTEIDSFTVSSINTGYQRIRPEQSTGAVSQISTKEYESRISSDFLDGLVNRLPGLMINNNVNFTSTDPDGTVRSKPLFNIRGISTMSANQSPLIVIDGYPSELSLNMIDPNEIQSVTILKDAAAATVYGVRASNGVIVIVRKQATEGKARFQFRATVGIKPKEDYSRYRWDDDASSIYSNYHRNLSSSSINANTWGQLATSTGGNVQRQRTYYILAQQAANMITAEQAGRAWDELTNYNNLDDYSRLFQRSAVTQTYNLNVSGGNANALYYITANYTGNRLSQIKNNDNRLQLSARTTLKMTDKLSLELTTNYQEENVNGAPVPDITSIAPYERFQDVNGIPTSITASGISPWYNDVLISQGLYNQLYYPLIDLNEISDKTHTVNNRVTANFKYDIGRGFDLNFGGIYETSRSDIDYNASELSSVARRYTNSYVVANTDGTFKYNVPKGGYLRQETANTSSYTARAQLNYNKNIRGDHSINGILGAEVRSLVEKRKLASYFGYNKETLLQQPVDYAGITNGTIRGSFNLGSPLSNYNALFNQQYTEDRFISAYSNLVYSYKNTYSVTGSIRIDQSNLFGTNPKYKYKPLWSVGAAWNIHREDFMQDLYWVKQLKLRVAYGFNGNVAKMSLPQVIAQSVLNKYTSPTSTALDLVSYANSSLRWEQTNSFNVGVDYQLFKNISGTIDYYRKKSTDLLGNSLIDPTIGASPSLINRATINNNGLELALRADWIATNKFNWNTGIVVARNTSKVLDVYQKGDFNPQTLNALGFVKGYPVGALFAYRWAGLDNQGYALIKDAAGKEYRTNDNTLGSATTALMASDTSGLTYYMGSSIPTINAGLSNRIDVGDFYFFCMINYYGGFKMRVPRPNPSAPRPLEGTGTYWKAAGDELTTDVMGLAGYNSANSNNAYNYADKYVVNGDYITLGDLTVSYTLDKTSFIKRAGFSNFEVKAQASNVFTVGLNKYNYSMATGGYQKPYVTPTYTIGIFTNF